MYRLLWTCLILSRSQQMRPLLHLGPNVITDGTFIMLGSQCYYRWDLYYAWVQLLHLCLVKAGWLLKNSRTVYTFISTINWIAEMPNHDKWSHELFIHHDALCPKLPLRKFMKTFSQCFKGKINWYSVSLGQIS